MISSFPTPYPDEPLLITKSCTLSSLGKVSRRKTVVIYEELCPGCLGICPLLSACPHNINAMDNLLDELVGLVPTDKGFIDTVRQALLEERRAVLMVIPSSEGGRTVSSALLKMCRRNRKCVETVGSHLTERFAVAC